MRPCVFERGIHRAVRPRVICVGEVKRQVGIGCLVALRIGLVARVAAVGCGKEKAAAVQGLSAGIGAVADAVALAEQAHLVRFAGTLFAQVDVRAESDGEAPFHWLERGQGRRSAA
eukprot:COSAG01_NODE_8851_length_2637_cov_6.265957_2_plen_116_part_00